MRANTVREEIIKAREWIRRIGPLTKVIPLKLFLNIVPSSSADITRAFAAWTYSVYVVSFRFKAKKNLQHSGDVLSDIWFQAKDLPLSGYFNKFQSFNRSLNKRWMSPAQRIATEWTVQRTAE